MSKTIKHEVDERAKANKRVTNWRRDRKNSRLEFRFFGIDDFYIYNELVETGEFPARGWWTG